MTAQEKYKQDGNSDEFSKKIHDRAWEIANDLNKQLLNLSTGIIAAMFFLVFDKQDKLTGLGNWFILLTIFLFGCSILFIILSKQWDASKNYFLGQINDSTKQTDEERGKMNLKKSILIKSNEWQSNVQDVFFFSELFHQLFSWLFIYLNNYNTKRQWRLLQ